MLVHGLFGSATNWRGVARVLSDRFHVITVDLPNHGRSEHTPTMHYAAMSTALRELANRTGYDKLSWVGHSMGGKAVMDLALTHPEYVCRLVVVDIAPVPYTGNHAGLIDAMMNLDLSSINSRADADRALSAVIGDTPTRLFLLQNLVPEDGGYHWRLNLPVLNGHLDDIMGFREHAGVTFRGPVLALNGENSDYVTSAHHPIFLKYFPDVTFETITDAGHWVQADQPRAVCEALIRFMNEHS